MIRNIDKLEGGEPKSLKQSPLNSKEEVFISTSCGICHGMWGHLRQGIDERTQLVGKN